MGSLSQKTQNSRKFQPSKNDTPGGKPLDPKNANYSTIEFRAEPPMFLIDIQVVYEEQLIKASNVNIPKFSKVRGALWFLGVIFCIPQKLLLGSTGRSHFYGTLVGSPRVYRPYTSSPNSTWGELALSNAQCVDSKTWHSGTRGMTVKHKYNSFQHSKVMITWHHSQVTLPPPPFVQHPATYCSLWQGASGTKGVNKEEEESQSVKDWERIDIHS